MKRYRNPIRGTVERFIEAGALRRMRRSKKKRAAVTKSNFVRFFESLENRGPDSIGSGRLFEKWAKKIRADMEKCGTWPKPTDDYSIAFVAEYVSRLMREMWNAEPRKIPRGTAGKKIFHMDRMNIRDWCHADPEFRRNVIVMRMLFRKVRNKGMRDGSYYTKPWHYMDTPFYTFVAEYRGRYSGNATQVFPYDPPRPPPPFLDQALDI